jgi:hypothetical protein
LDQNQAIKIVDSYGMNSYGFISKDPNQENSSSNIGYGKKEQVSGSENFKLSTPIKGQNISNQASKTYENLEEGFHNPITNSPLMSGTEIGECSSSNSKIFRRFDPCLSSPKNDRKSIEKTMQDLCTKLGSKMQSSSKKFEHAASPLVKRDFDDTQSMNNTICKFLDRIDDSVTKNKEVSRSKHTLINSNSLNSFEDALIEMKSPSIKIGDNLPVQKKNARKTLSFSVANTGKGAASKIETISKGKKSKIPSGIGLSSPHTALTKSSSQKVSTPNSCKEKGEDEKKSSAYKYPENKENKSANNNTDMRASSPKPNQNLNKITIKYPLGVKPTDTVVSSDTKEFKGGLCGKKIINSLEMKKN